MSVADYYYYETPSGRPMEAVAYIRGTNPDPHYRMLSGEVLERWTIPHFDIGGFDETTGERTQTGTLTDFLNSNLIWLIVRRRIRDLLTRLGVGPRHVQWLDVCIHHEGKEIVGEYFAANVLDVRSAVNEERSKYTRSGHILAVPVLRRDRIRGADIFRVEEWRTRVYFSPRIKRALCRERATGVEWGRSLVAD